MDAEYGNNIDICPEVIGELTGFKYSTGGDTSQFLELYNKYNRAKQDLKQVNKLSELNNLTTLKMITEKLLGELLRTEYAKVRSVKKFQAGVTELDIFDIFMCDQYKIQKEKSKFDTTDDQSRSVKSFKGNCNNCGGLGHRSQSCPSPSKDRDQKAAKVNHVVGTSRQPKPCPACNGQYTKQIAYG